MRSCSNIAGIYDILMQHQWKKRTLSPPLSRTGDCESVLFALLFIYSLFWYMHWLAKRKTNYKTQFSTSFLGTWKNSTLYILPLEPKKQKKTKIQQLWAPQSFSRIFGFFVFFFCFFCFFGFQLWSFILCREFCSWGLPVGDAMLKWQVQPYFFSG